jgi:hypothetical protein
MGALQCHIVTAAESEDCRRNFESVRYPDSQAE